MSKHPVAIILAVLVVGLLLATTVTYIIPTTAKGFVKTFGAAGEPIDGRQQAGLKVKWPYPVQRLVRYEGRIFTQESPLMQFETADKKIMQATLYCAWRIDDVIRFNRTVVTEDSARARIGDLFNDSLKILGNHDMAEYINTDPAAMRLATIESEVQDFIAEQAREQYGIEVVMVGLKSLGLPENVSKQVINAMKQERQKFITRYRAAGEAQAETIRERAKSAREKILAFAERRAAEIRSEGDRWAAKQLKKFRKNEPLAMYLLWLRSLRKILSENTEIILDASTLEPIEGFLEAPTELPGADSADSAQAGDEAVEQVGEASDG